MLKTQLSNGRRSSLEKSRYKYLDTKTEMKNMSINAEHSQGHQSSFGPQTSAATAINILLAFNLWTAHTQPSLL